MRSISVVRTALLIPAIVATTSVSAQTLKERSYDLAVATVTGDSVRGPARIVARNLDIVRYDYGPFNIAVSFTSAPDLWSQLAKAAAPSVTTPAPPAKKAAGAGPESEGPPESPLCALALKDKVEPALIPGICASRALRADIDNDIRPIDEASSGVIDIGKRVVAFVQTANNSTSTVTAAGKALTSFLGTNRRDSTDAINGITMQLEDQTGGLSLRLWNKGRMAQFS
jgi:hypothetical protein